MDHKVLLFDLWGRQDNATYIVLELNLKKKKKKKENKFNLKRPGMSGVPQLKDRMVHTQKLYLLLDHRLTKMNWAYWGKIIM